MLRDLFFLFSRFFFIIWMSFILFFNDRCAHDRQSFGKGGWGRLAIGMYVVFLEKWLEHFPTNQFLVVRLEDVDKDPVSFYRRIFQFLELEEPYSWNHISMKTHANANANIHEPVFEETLTLLKDFYRPYNVYLTKLLNDDNFLWSNSSNVAKADTQKSIGNLLSMTKQSVSDLVTSSSSSLSASASAAISTIRDPFHGDHFLSLDSNNHTFGADLSLSTLASRLRGQSSGEIGSLDRGFVGTFHPRSFAIENLPPAINPQFNGWLSSGKIINRSKPPQDPVLAGVQLCSAAYGMDIDALKYLLYDIGISPQITNSLEVNRNAFHCLASIFTIADAHPRSQIFALLKGASTWVDPYLDKSTGQLFPKMTSVMSLDVVKELQTAVLNAAHWLLAAGTSVVAQDDVGNTPLHVSVMGGMLNLTVFLLEHGANPNTVNHENRSAVHYAASYGHSEILDLLVRHGGDLHAKDQYLVSAIDIISNPGPISPADAWDYFSIKQRKPRQIDRSLHPEWQYSDGGWNTQRLHGFEDDVFCEADQFWADEVTGDKIFHEYVARGAPVLIRGLINHWKVIEDFRKDNLMMLFGEVPVEVSRSVCLRMLNQFFSCCY